MTEQKAAEPARSSGAWVIEHYNNTCGFGAMRIGAARANVEKTSREKALVKSGLDTFSAGLTPNLLE
jgi:hypothetical protein